MTEKVVLTREGYEKLAAELQFLKTKKRKEVADQLEFARGLGDLRENSEYETAKHEKSKLEGRIASLENRLAIAKIVDVADLPKDKAVLTAKVEIKNLNTGDTFQYTLVSQDEADINAGKLSVTSPIGKGLLGKGPGEIAQIQVPAGLIKFEIIRILND